MGELEVNFSKYQDTNSEYYSHKMNERQSLASDPYLSNMKTDVSYALDSKRGIIDSSRRTGRKD